MSMGIQWNDELPKPGSNIDCLPAIRIWDGSRPLIGIALWDQIEMRGFDSRDKAGK
jgi:hypothetical protein